MPESPSQVRTKALLVLKSLLCRLFSLHADLFHAALLDAGFPEARAGVLVGACIRTGASRRWMTKTAVCVPSQRNHSNLQRVWLSNLHGPYSQRGAQSMRDIRHAYAFWESKGLRPPDELAEKWRER